MATYGYLRSSTKLQDASYQESEILSYSNRCKLGNVEFVTDVVSGAKDWKLRKVGDLVLKTMKENDILLVNEYSRLGRSLLDILNIIEELKKKNCKIHIVRESMVIDDSLNSTLFTFMMGLVSQIERDLIQSRVSEGIKQKRTNEDGTTKAWGRPKGSQYKSSLDSKREDIKMLLQKDISKSAIAKMLDINYQTLNSYIKTRELVKEIAA